MIETLACVVALMIVVFFAQSEMKRGSAPGALSRMLIALFAFFVSLRWWFALAHWVATYESNAPLPPMAVTMFWVLFLGISLALAKLRDTYIEEYEVVGGSIVGRLVGGLLGIVTGAVFAMALALTASMLLPWISSSPLTSHYKAGALPIPVDRASLAAFRFVESHIARVRENDPARTPLPNLEKAGSEDPMKFWR